MRGKPLSSVAHGLNNVLTVVAMCTDELEGSTSSSGSAALADLRESVRRGMLLVRELLEHAAAEDIEDLGATSDVVTAHAPTVLVIDEDDALRGAVARGIETRGWRAVQAPSVEAARQSLETIRAVDLIIVDTTAAGRRFASQLVERYPNAAVLYLGGYVDEAPLRDELPQADVSLLRRPFEPGQVVERIGETIARR